MPYFDEPQVVHAFTHQATLVAADTLMTISTSFFDDGTYPEGYADNLLLELMDLLQTWSGRSPGTNVTGQRYDVRMYGAVPTNLDPVPPDEGE